jgi:hypothetical protein
VTANAHSTSTGALAPSQAAADAVAAAASAAGRPRRHPRRSTPNRWSRAPSRVATSAGTRISWVGSTAATANALKNNA